MAGSIPGAGNNPEAERYARVQGGARASIHTQWSTICRAPAHVGPGLRSPRRFLVALILAALILG